jgi:hypothetical protein
MIDFELEKNRTLTTEQIAMILDLSAQAASDGGFVSSYIFERAVMVFAAQVLYPEKKDEIAAMIGNGYDIRLAFDTLLSSGLLEKMSEDYSVDMQLLREEGYVWLEEVKEFQQSARGILDSINTLSGDIVQSAVQQLQQVASGDVKVIEDFANRWGFDRPTPGKDKIEQTGEIQKAFEVLDGGKTKE